MTVFDVLTRQSHTLLPGTPFVPQWNEDGTDAKPAEERQPRKPPLLVRPERAAKAVWCRRWREPLVGPAGQQVAEPPVGIHLGQRQVTEGAVGPEPSTSKHGAEYLGGGHRARPLAFQELQRGLQVPVVEFHPLTAHPDERDLARGELGQFRSGEHLVAEGQVVAEGH